MVFKNINRIKSALPDVIHIVMFYSNGTVFQSTFEQELNIPKLGENLSEALHRMRKLYELCNFHFEDYSKLIFETENISVIILKLGEDSNIALFFKKEDIADVKLSSIKRYLTRIEELVDMDQKELILQEIIIKEKELANLEKDYSDLNSNIQKKTHEKSNSDNLDISEKLQIEIHHLIENRVKLESEIMQKQNELRSLRESIEKTREDE